MSSIYLDVILCFITYLILVGFIFWRKHKRNRPDDTGNDGDGGLPVESGPKLDLPPGVCLPGDGPSVIKRDQYDEALI